MNILTRSTFEYSVRLRYLHQNPEHACRQIDSLPVAIQRELKMAVKMFTPQTVEKLADSYKTWELQHADVAKDYKEVQFTQMAREVLAENFDTEWWKWYTHPSIVAHSKPLAISDTMRIDDENHILTLMPNSRHFDAYTELGKVASLVTELIGFITVYYQVDARPYLALDEKLSNVLAQCGYGIKTHHIGPKTPNA